MCNLYQSKYRQSNYRKSINWTEKSGRIKKIELVPRDELIEKGNIWKSSILRHDVSVLDKYMVTENGIYKLF